MRNLFVFASIGFVIFAIIVGVVVSNSTSPYVVVPISVSTAPTGSRVGHLVDFEARTLTVVTSGDLVVVADPGKSFKYEVLWLVEPPRSEKGLQKAEYRYELPEAVSTSHINKLGADIPEKISRAAQRKW